MRRCPLLLCGLWSLALPLPLRAEDAAARPMVTYSGIADVAPGPSLVAESATQLAARLPQRKDLRQFDETFSSPRNRQEELGRRMTALGDMRGWSCKRLVEIKGALSE